MTVDEAILELARDPAQTEALRDGYLGRSAREDAAAFAASAEFAATVKLLGRRLAGAVVADVGAGRGIASYALARAGAARVVAIEPSPSALLGTGAIRECAGELPIQILECCGEAIELPAASVDIVYCRQTLHHAGDLDRFVAECARILRPGGVLLATREHVVDDAGQLAVFLAAHPVHRLAGGEHAFAASTYAAAIRRAGLRMRRIFRPYDSVICAYPEVRTERELEALPRRWLRRKFGRLGAALGYVPGATAVARARLNRRTPPGRLFSFLAEKQA